MASLKSLFTSPAPEKKAEGEGENLLLPLSEPVISEQEETQMDLSPYLTYTPGPGKGKPATWTCGKATIQAPKLKQVVTTVASLASALSNDGRANLFTTMMETQAGKAGKEFLSALDLKEIPYLEVVSFIGNHVPKKGKPAGSGGGKSGKVIKAFAKAVALKYPAATSKEQLFMSLLSFIENMENQEAIFKAFSGMASVNGTDDKGMIQLRLMTPEARAKAVAHGKALGAGKAKAAAKKGAK